MVGNIEKMLIYISIIICFVLFFLLMTETIDKFTKRMTNIGVNVQESSVSEKMLPCITVCPWMAFKSFGFHYSSKNFSQNTFEKGEVFLNATKYSVFNESNYALEEIRSIFFGQCFTIRPLKPKKKMDAAYFALNIHMDYKGNCSRS